VLLRAGRRKELSVGFAMTTNNRMEMLAAIVGLEALNEPCQVTLYSDSRYLVDAMTKGWAYRWQQNNWWRNKREQALNPDLWERLLALCEIHQVEFVWTKGHAGDRENERCDWLAVRAANRKDLPPDDGFDPDAERGPIRITQEGHYEYYFYCPNCETMYMVEDAKRKYEDKDPRQLSF
jgi:ribonuclease HI